MQFKIGGVTIVPTNQCFDNVVHWINDRVVKDKIHPRDLDKKYRIVHGICKEEGKRYSHAWLEYDDEENKNQVNVIGFGIVFEIDIISMKKNPIFKREDGGDDFNELVGSEIEYHADRDSYYETLNIEETTTYTIQEAAPLKAGPYRLDYLKLCGDYDPKAKYQILENLGKRKVINERRQIC